MFGSAQGQLSEAEANLSTLVTAHKTADMRVKHLSKEAKDVEKKLAEARKSSKSQASLAQGVARKAADKPCPSSTANMAVP